MKSTILLMLTLFALVGCQSKESSSTTNNTTTQNPSTDFCAQNTMAYGCPGYCAANPGICAAGSTTTSGTAGGAGGGTNGNYGTLDITPPSDNNWGSQYPNGFPAVNCQAATGTGYETHKGTITMSGNAWYSPDNAWGSVGESEFSSIHYTHNVSSFLTDVNEAKQFIDSDGLLKVRFMVKPQISPGKKSWCFNRTILSPDPVGYTALRFTVALRKVNANGSLGSTLISAKSLTVPLNSCSTAVDFSGLNQSYPNGIVLVVRDVYKDSGCWYKAGCVNNWEPIKAKDCWQMDVEVAVDDTKTFN